MRLANRAPPANWLGVRRTADPRLEFPGFSAFAPNLLGYADYNKKLANPYVASELGYLDDVIEPMDSRPRLIAALRFLQNKRQELPPKKHGNLPL